MKRPRPSVGMTKEHLRAHRALVLRLKRDGCPADYIRAKVDILKAHFAKGSNVSWREIWLNSQ